MFKKTLSIIQIFLISSLITAACLGDNPGEVYFNAYTKDGNGHYTVQSLYKTSDYGHTAKVVFTNFNASIFKDKTPGVYYKIALGGHALYISRDTCRTWQWQSVLDSGGESFKTGIFAGECNDANRTSSDYGRTWTVRTYNGLSGGSYSWCLGLESGEIYAYMYNQKLYRSTDYGDNYTMVNDMTGFGQGGVWHGWQIDELFIGRASDGKVFRSIDNGQTYNYLYQGPGLYNPVYWMLSHLPNDMIGYTVKISPPMIYDQMVIKFFRTTDWYQTIDSVETNYNVGITNQSKITNYELSNYPNPFNSTTTINYNLPADCNVKLTVYNTKGQTVKNLISNNQTAGEYQYQYKAENLTSGIYYLMLETADQRQCKKIMLIK